MAHPHDTGAVLAADERDRADGPSLARAAERRCEVDSLNERARSYMRVDYVRLQALAEQAFELACQLDEHGDQYRYGMARALASLADGSTTKGNWTDALSQSAQAMSLAEAEDLSLRSDILGTIGWTHFCMGDYAEALEELMQALTLAEAADDRGLQAHMLSRIGSVQSSAGHHDSGLDCQQRALAIHLELSDAIGEALVRNNMTYTLLALGQHPDALASAEAALAFASQANLPYLLVAVLDTVAEVHLRMGALDAALRYSAEALELARELESETDEATILMALGRIACARHAWEQALGYASDALVLAERKELAVETFECHRLLSQIHEQRGDLVAALAHFRAYHELKQARVNEETEARLANLRVTHQVETAKKDAEIHRLRNLALEREVEERRVAQAKLEAQASLDPLTGLFNRGHFALLAGELSPQAQVEGPVSLLMFDVDRFKSVNDTYGHVAGDRVLTAITRELRENARQTDIACRYGGDEFLVMLLGMDKTGAIRTAERLRDVISATPVRVAGHDIRVTISVGVATAKPGGACQVDELIERADRALYAAKQSGRNRVEVDDGSPLPSIVA